MSSKRGRKIPDDYKSYDNQDLYSNYKKNKRNRNKGTSIKNCHCESDSCSYGYRQSCKTMIHRDWTPTQKWWIAFLVGVLFAIISSNFLYGVTDEISRSLGLPEMYCGGGATGYGLLVHTLIFIVVVRILLW